MQVGDRIKVYATLNGIKAETNGMITDIRADGMFFVCIGDRKIIAHPKQCRKLKKQKRKITIWVGVDDWLISNKNKHVFYTSTGFTNKTSLEANYKYGIHSIEIEVDE
jgi:hypothetical protein